jgi:hypothetical protein
LFAARNAGVQEIVTAKEGCFFEHLTDDAFSHIKTASTLLFEPTTTVLYCTVLGRLL